MEKLKASTLNHCLIAMSKVQFTYEQLNDVHSLCRDRDNESYIKGGNKLLFMLGVNSRFKDTEVDKAKKLINSLVFEFLDRDEYLSAATLMFGFDYFDPRPPHVADIYRIWKENDETVIFGASSMSKSWAIGIILVCDWVRDPYYTRITVGSVGEEHLKRNLFSGIISAVNDSIIDIAADVSLPSMMIRPKGMTTQDSGIYGQAFPRDSSTSTGRLRGIKPRKRAGKPHPKFGKSGRVRILLDEASNIDEGVFKDFGSAMSSNDGNGRVKFCIAFNPTIVEHWTREIAQPVGGIEVIDEDSDIGWQSEKGWAVYRLDGMRSPNVMAKAEVCEGVMTWPAMKKKMASGDGSEDYWVYGRGMWMRRGHFSNIVTMDFLTKNRGELIFPEGSTNCASIDVAYATDKVIMTIGRWGNASGFTQTNGEIQYFENDGKKLSRWSLQIDQQFELSIPNTDSIELAKEIVKLCKDMKVDPEWLGIDRTAIGKGVFDILNRQWGPVCGINWQDGSSKTLKIMADDVSYPNDLYLNISTEMWFCTRQWLEHGVIKIGSNVRADPLFTELTTRRYKPSGSRIKVENKIEYKHRASGGISPDRADSFIMLPHLCRVQGGYLPSIQGGGSSYVGTKRMGEQEEGLVVSDTLDSGDTLGFVQDKERGFFKGIVNNFRNLISN